MKNSRIIHMSEEVLNKLRKTVVNHPRIVAGVLASTVLLGSGIHSLYEKDRIQNIYGISEEKESSYDSYSMQLEDMLDIDISTGDEKRINALDKYREYINDYNNADSYAKQYDAFSNLASGRYKIEDVCLSVAKGYLSSTHGGMEKGWTLSYDKDSDAWVAHDNNQSMDLKGNVRELVDYIGVLQSYPSTDEIKDPDEFVDVCDKLIMNAGKVIGEKTEELSKEGQMRV